MAKEQTKLLKVNELRPLPFSKTVTLFEVYETDEENFEPYISPLATVGTLPSSSQTPNTGSGSESFNSEEGTEGEDKGRILGMGTGVL